MDYDVHQTKKFIRKNRLQIVLGLLGLVIVAVFVVNLIGDNHKEIQNAILIRPPKEAVSSEESNGNINQENMAPLKPTTQEKPGVPSVTKYIDTYEILSSNIRNGTQYYTQGLLFKDSDTLIESAGLYGESAIHYINLTDMSIGLQAKLESKFFGEGCELYDNGDEEEIYQLTWRERKIIVWDAEDLTQKRTIDLPQPIREGWGIAKQYEADEKGNVEAVFYISDGSDKIYVVDPQTFKIKRSITAMKSDKTTVRSLNELEFVKGKLWANVYMTNNVLVIDPETGFVEYIIDLSKLKKLAQAKALEMNFGFRSDYVLNGIAYDPTNDKLIITGKKWPLIWEIRVDGIN